MLFQVHIQNLGKLADATVRVSPLTVLAGVNNTGKSFFSKFFYSLLSAMGEMNGHPVARHIASMLDRALTGLDALQRSGYDKQDAVTDLIARVGALKEAAYSIQMVTASIESAHPDFARLVDDAVNAMSKIYADVHRLADERNPIFGHAEFGDISGGLNRLAGIMTESAVSVAATGVREVVTENLLGNFQVAKLTGLQNDPAPEKGISGNVAGFGEFCIRDRYTSPNMRDPRKPSPPDEPVKHSLPYRVHDSRFDDKLLSLREYSRVIYLDSPTFWRIRDGVKNARLSRTVYFGEREEVVGIPKYFHDSERLLDKTLTGDVPFPHVVERIANVIGGKVVRDTLGRMEFVEGDRRFPLSSTAMGVANLGVLALAIERKLLDPGAFLFIDEPESNLHPEWQVKMTEALWELARGGVNVVIATHGVDILKRLDIYAKEEKEEAEKIIAVNHFQRDGTVQSGGVEMIRGVKRDLSAPFFKLYKRGL